MARTISPARSKHASYLVNVDTNQALCQVWLKWTLELRQDEDHKMNWGVLYRRSPPSFENLLGSLADPDSQYSPLTALPIELLETIFMLAHDIKDAISLCISSKHLLRVGQRLCASRMAAILGPCAGARLVCIRYFDWETQGKLLMAKGGPTAEISQGSGPNAEYDRFVVRKKLASDSASLSESIHSYEPLNSRLSGMESLLLHRFVDEINDRAPWVLCNLSKRRYVLYHDVRGKAWEQLGAILISQICWFLTDSTYRWQDAPRQGKWVGDRFEITTLNDLKGGPDEWIDLSAELFAELEEIRKSNWDGLE